MVKFDCEFLELFEYVDHVLWQPARGNAQAPAASFRVANFLHEDSLFGCVLA